MFCRMSLNLGLSDVFLMIGLWLWSFRRKITDVKGSHQVICVEYYQVDVITLDTWLKQCLLAIPTVKVLFSLSVLCSLEASHQVQSLGSGGWARLCSPPWKGAYLCVVLENRDKDLRPPIYLFSYLYQYGLMYTSFILWIMFILLLKSFQLGYWESSQVGPWVSDMPILWSFEHSRSFWKESTKVAPGSCIFPALTSTSSVPFTGYWFLMELRNQDLDTACACGYRVSLLLDPPSKENYAVYTGSEVSLRFTWKIMQ